MAFSVAIRIKSDYRLNGRPHPTRRDGTSALYLRVIIEGEVKKIPLEQSWHPAHFDEDRGLCVPCARAALPEHQDAQRCADVNLVCQQALGDAQKVFTEFRLRRQPPTLDGFLREFRSLLSKDDLVAYFGRKLEERLAERLICADTYKNQRGSFNRLREFRPKLPFAALAEQQFAQKFEAWLLRQNYKATTRWAFHKDVKTYLNLARLEDNIWFPDPYATFTLTKPQKGDWKPIVKRDILLLDAYYRTLSPGTPRRYVLRRWLFALASCGMRISDQVRNKEDWRMLDVLSFVPWKNRKTGRTLLTKLSTRAQQLWDEAVTERDAERPYVFTRISGQKANEHLHQIEQELGITMPLHNHIARHTFATQFLEAGGQVHMLQKLMNHANIQTTMIYVEPTNAAYLQAAEQVDGMFSAGPPRTAPASPAPRMRPSGWQE